MARWQEVETMRFARSLYGQVLIAVGLGALLGYLNPQLGAAMKPLGDGFIKLVRMLIAPIIFATVVTGIAKMGADVAAVEKEEYEAAHVGSQPPEGGAGVNPC
jgi:Na+/H+-dicarboxylate symporter